MASFRVARCVSQLLQHQQLPHWDTLCLPLRLLSTAAAANATDIIQQQPHWASSSHNTLSHPSSTLKAALSTPSSSSSSSMPTGSGANTSRARVLDGKAVAAAWLAELQQQVQEISRVLNRRPGLAVVLVGNRPDSLIYVSRKQEACMSIGIHCRVLRLPDNVSQADLQACVSEVSADRAIDGVLVQLPLPQHLDEEAVMEALAPRKDVDGFHPLNMGRMLMRGRAPRFVPATPLGVVELLSRSGVSLAGKTAVVLGDSNIVGTPIAALLRDAGVALVTTCHRVSLQDWFEHQARSQLDRAAAPDVCLPRLFGPTPPSEAQHTMPQHASSGSSSSSSSSSRSSVQQQSQQEAQSQSHAQSHSQRAVDNGFQPSHLPAICRTADILVVAVGSPRLIRADWVKPGAVVVDVGINVVPSPKQVTAGANEQQQQQQEAHSGMQVAQGSMPASAQSHPQQQQQQQQQQQGAEAPMAHQLATSRSSSSSSSGPGCKPQVQLKLVETDSGALNVSSDYSVVGDVAHDEVACVASVLTPVPGGVGPMTIAAVLHNTIQAAKYTAGLLRW